MSSIQHLSDFLATMPGLGPRSARRIVLQMLRDKQKMMHGFASLLRDVADNTQECIQCNNIDVGELCSICNNFGRDRSRLCIVEEIGDLWNIEKSGHFSGLYYVLGGCLHNNCSSPEDLNLKGLLKCVNAMHQLEEIIIANNATVYGHTTAFYITDLLISEFKKNGRNIIITTLGQGMPIGAELDYLDEGTIGAAFRSRKAASQI